MLTATVSPALDHIIERPRLIARIVEGNGRVTVFAAPAGYGKTTLARQWAERQTGPVVWYRTSRASGDVAVLSVGLDETLASIAPELPRDPGRVARIASVNPSPRPLGRALVQTYESLGKDVLLIVDEWEAAGTEEAEQLLSTLVDQLKIRFLITTRTRPDWFTPRLEVYGEGVEIGVDELTMTDEEAAEVLFYVRNKETSSDVAGLAAGWPAVLGLAALRARRSQARDASTPLPDALYEYFTAELVDSAERSVQDAATLIAAAAVSDYDVAQTLLGPEADPQLTKAEAHGLLTRDGTKISMHPLIAQTLVSAFRADATSRDRLTELTAVIVRHRLWHEALSLTEAVPVPSFITAVLTAALPELVRSGRLTSLRRWVTEGRAAGADSAVVDYAEAELSLRSGSTLRAYGLGERAAKALRADLAARAHLVAARAAHLRERPAATLEHAEAAAALATSDETREGAAWLRLLSAFETQSQTLDDLLREYQQVARDGIEQTLRVATAKLNIAQIEGGLAEALDSASIALSLVDGDVEPMIYTALLNIQSYGLLLAGRYQKSLATTETLRAFAETYGLEFVDRYARLNQAVALIGMRRFATADRLLGALERETRDEDGTYFGCNITMQRGRLYASVGDIGRALDVLSLGPRPEWIRAEKGEFLGLHALLLAASGAREAASAKAEDARTASRGLETRALAYLADAAVALGDKKRVEEVDVLLDHAIATEAFDPMVIAMRAVPALASHMATQADRHEWIRRLLTSSADASLARSVGLRIPRAVWPRAQLSPREAEIHELVAQGLTNEEISKLLFISVSTTKVHVKHILEKLGVRSRIEAARALYDEETASASPIEDLSPERPDQGPSR